MTQRQLAEKAGVAVGSYRDVEQARNPNPPVQLLIRCAIALGCSLSELIEDSWWDAVAGSVTPVKKA